MLPVGRALRQVMRVTAPMATNNAATAAYVDGDTEAGTPIVHNEKKKKGSNSTMASVNLVVFVNGRTGNPNQHHAAMNNGLNCGNTGQPL